MREFDEVAWYREVVVVCGVMRNWFYLEWISVNPVSVLVMQVRAF